MGGGLAWLPGTLGGKSGKEFLFFLERVKGHRSSIPAMGRECQRVVPCAGRLGVPKLFLKKATAGDLPVEIFTAFLQTPLILASPFWHGSILLRCPPQVSTGLPLWPGKNSSAAAAVAAVDC